jgi:glycerol-3-phosphate acyltransferase PlsY
MELLISIITGYFLGNIQTAYLIGKLAYNIDIRNEGSKNPGSSNAVLVWGWPVGILTFVVDVLKAASAIWLIQWLFPGESTLPIVAGLCAVIGHVFPVIMNFKGGKGVASVIGMMVGMDPIIAVALALTIVIISLLTNHLFWGEFAGLFSFPVVVFLIGYPKDILMLVAVATLLSIYCLRGNFLRTIRGEEATVTSALKKK